MTEKKKRRGRPPKVKRGRPKGSKNKRNLLIGLENPVVSGFKPVLNLSSRLDECMTNLETAVAEAISKLKEMI